jgi:hypothetical protein
MNSIDDNRLSVTSSLIYFDIWWHCLRICYQRVEFTGVEAG